MNSIKNYQILILIVGFTFYILFRFWNITESCLFFDEIFSVHAAKQSWGMIFGFVAQDLIHPPLFYILLKIWISIGGESLFWLRFFSLIFSIIAFIPFCLLCREIKLNYWSFVFAITFFAVNGCLIKYAQEVRMYCVLLCFGFFSIWIFIRFFNENKGFGSLILINILLVYTHYFGWLIVFSQLISVLILRREKLKQSFLMFGLTGLSFLPWVYQIWQASKVNFDFKQNLGWAESPKLTTIYHFINDLFEPFYFQQTNADRAEILFITAPLVFIWIISSILFIQNWKEESNKRELILLLILFKTPIVIALCVSWILPVSVWGTRHLIISFPLLMIFFGLVLEKIKIKELKIVFVSIVFLFILLGLFGQLIRGTNKPVWCSWEDLAKNLPLENVKLYVFEDLIAYHIWSALGENKNTQIIVVKGIEGLKEDTAYFLPRGFDEIKITDDKGIEGQNFYIAFRDVEFNEFQPPLSNLKAKGYKIGEPKIFEAQKIKTYLVKVWKEN